MRIIFIRKFLGTYLWGPDEVDNMRELGNEHAENLYGGKEFRPLPNASDAVWRQFIIDKYEHNKFAQTVQDQKRKDLVAAYIKPRPLQSNLSQNRTSSQIKKKVGLPLVPVGDLLHFDEGHSESTTASKTQCESSERKTHQPTDTVTAKDDFFAEFGL